MGKIVPESSRAFCRGRAKGPYYMDVPHEQAWKILVMEEGAFS
jgi:hypothetical protein